MKSTGKEKNRLQQRSTCSITFQTLYGIGKTKATKINIFLLNHPKQKNFKENLQITMNTAIGSNILSKIPFGGKVRICVYNQMEKKITTYCYQAHRLFQNLPVRGQRTRTNAQTSRKRSPYNILEMNLKFFQGAATAYKRLELIHNGRYDELKAYEKRSHEMKKEETNLKKKK